MRSPGYRQQQQRGDARAGAQRAAARVEVGDERRQQPGGGEARESRLPPPSCPDQRERDQRHQD